MLAIFGTLYNQSDGVPFLLEGSVSDYNGHYFSDGIGYIFFCGYIRIKLGVPVGGWGSGIFLSVLWVY